MNEKLSFAVENIELLEESNKSQFATLKIDAFASGNNSHSLYISENALRESAKTLLEKPIVWIYNKNEDDAKSHGEDEVAVGFIPKDSPIEFRKLSDGRVMCSVIGKLWTRYSGRMMDVFKRDKSKGVSVEIEVLDKRDVSEYGVPEIISYCYQCITVLGKFVRPAIEGAHAELLSFSRQDKEDYLKILELEFSNKYYGIDFTIPQKVKEEAQRALDAYKEKGNNVTSVSLAMARFLINNEKITPEKIKLMAKFFNRKSASDEFVSGFYGGQAGAKWSRDMYKSIIEAENKLTTYFKKDDNILTFPYKSLKDINPALKGIKPPLTLDQANAIAAQADAIGTDEKKNGWAIAISNWKSRHKVKNGRWVEKEKPDSTKNAEDAEEISLSEKEGKFVSNEEELLKDENLEEEEIREEESPEEREEEVGEESNVEMSLDGNLDVAAMLKILEAETEDYKNLVEGHKSGNIDYAKLSSMLYEKLCKMSKEYEEDKTAYLAENTELKKFKSEIEGKQFEFEVESTLNEISDTMPKDKIIECREDSRNFSLDNVDIWKNKVKALAFSYTKDNKPSDGINRIAISWINGSRKENSIENGWL